MTEILIVAASNNKNLELAKKFEAEFKNIGHQSTIIDVVNLDLPLYTTEEDKRGTPENIIKIVPLLDQAKAYVIIAPEYNGGLPPALTNFLAWTSRSGDKDWRKYFNEKPCAIATFSGGGGQYLLSALRTQLAYIGMNVLGRQIITSFQKELDPKSLEAVCSQLIHQLR